MQQVYEDSASRWQRRLDGSWSPSPRPKSPPVRTQGLIEAVAAQGDEIATQAGQITAQAGQIAAQGDQITALDDDLQTLQADHDSNVAMLLTQRYFAFSSSGKLNDGGSIVSGLVVPNPGKADVKIALTFLGVGGFHTSSVPVQPTFTGGPVNDASPGAYCVAGQWTAIVRTAAYTFPDDSTDLTFGMYLVGGPAYVRGGIIVTVVG